MKQKHPQTQPQGQAVSMRQVSMSGPLPPPEILAGMEKVLPGAADRIVKMAEQAQTKSLELDAVNIGSIAFTRRALALGSVIGTVMSFSLVAGLGTAFFVLTFKGFEVQGGLSGLAAVAYAVLVRHRRKKNDAPAK